MPEAQGAFFGVGDCTHPHKIVIPEKRGPHYAKRVCRDCRKFLGWVPSPETIKRQAENNGILAALAKLPSLSEWERQFVRDLSTSKRISPKQQAKLLELEDRLLRKGECL